MSSKLCQYEHNSLTCSCINTTVFRVYLEATWKLLGCYLEATWRLLGCYFDTTLIPLGYHLFRAKDLLIDSCCFQSNQLAFPGFTGGPWIKEPRPHCKTKALH